MCRYNVNPWKPSLFPIALQKSTENMHKSWESVKLEGIVQACPLHLPTVKAKVLFETSRTHISDSKRTTQAALFSEHHHKVGTPWRKVEDWQLQTLNQEHLIRNKQQ